MLTSIILRIKRMTEDYIKLYQFTGKDIFGLRTFQPFPDEKRMEG